MRKEFIDIIERRLSLSEKENSSKVMPLDVAVRRFIRLGISLHLNVFHCKPNATCDEIIRQYRGKTPGLTLVMLGLVANQLAFIHGGLVKKKGRHLFRRRDMNGWVDMLTGEDICFDLVYNIEEALDDPHSPAGGTSVEVPVPGGGSVKVSAHPAVYSSTLPVTRGSDKIMNPAPRMGKHKAKNYGRRGLEISELKRNGVI